MTMPPAAYHYSGEIRSVSGVAIMGTTHNFPVSTGIFQKKTRPREMMAFNGKELGRFILRLAV
jgi:hypothetical protein